MVCTKALLAVFYIITRVWKQYTGVSVGEWINRVPSHNKVAPVIKKNEADFFVALEHLRCILYWVAGILYLLFCNISLKRAPAIVSASGFTKSVYTLGPNTPGRWAHAC